MYERSRWTRSSARPLSRRRLLGGATLAGAGAVLAACGGGSDSDSGSGGAASSSGGSAATTQQPVRGGTLTYQLGGDPPNLDLHGNSTYLVNTSVAPIYNQLIQFDANVAQEAPETLVGDLAKSWEQSSDGLRYTFKLNEGVTFHDGKPFTSADVKASLERIASPPRGAVSPREDSLKVIERVETPDSTTVAIVTSRPAPSLLPILAQGWMAIYSEKDIGGGFDHKLKTNGTGPFKLKEYLRGNRVILEPNEQYFVKGQPYLSGMTAFIMPDAGARVSAFQAGETMFSSLLTESDLKSLEPVLRNRMVVERRDGYGFNTINFGDNPPWRDERARRAVSLAMDRQSSIELLNEGQGKIGGYMSPSGAWTLPENEILALPGYGPVSDRTLTEARQLLSAAGARPGQETVLLTRRGATSENLSIFIRDQLQKVGIEAKPQVLEDGAAYDALNKRNFDLAPWAHAMALDDPDAIFAEFYLDKAPRNYSELSSAAVADLFNKQSQTLNQQERVKLVRDLQKTAMPLYGKVILAWGLRRWAWSSRVKGYTAHVGYYNNNRHAATWLMRDA